MNSYDLYVTKFITSMAMHLAIFREFDRGRIIIKYIISAPEKFESPKIPFLLGLCHIGFCFVHEFINMIILFNAETIFAATVSYMTVGILTQMNELFYDTTVEKDNDNVLKKVFDVENAPEIKKKNKKDNYTMVTTEEAIEMFQKESKWMKGARFIYAIIRGVYSSLSFYFVPFLFLIF